MTSTPSSSETAARVGLEPAAPRPGGLSALGRWIPGRQAPAGAAAHPGYRPDIDGLRAVAVLAVLFFHAGVAGVPGGFVGVDVFFVISGFVISRSLLADIEAGRFSITRFYERRVRRIFPALFAVFLATWALAMALFLPSYLIDYSRSLVASAGFLSNVYFWKNSGYFANGANLRPLLHTWSLSVEEQFYIFAPLALYLIHRLFRRRWALALAPVAALSFALSVYATRIGPTANFFLLPTRAWELLLGALLALRPLPDLRPRWAREAVALLGLGLIGWAVFRYTDATPFPGAAALAPCFGAAILIYVGSGGGSTATRILSWPPLVGVGLISYSLYLVHWPIVAFSTYYELRPPGPVEVAAIIGSSLALAILSWRFIEQPFRRRSFHPPRAALLGGGIACMAVAAVLGGAALAAHGLPGRFPNFTEQSLREPRGLWREGVCFLDNNPDLSKWSASACTLSHGGPPALLWGDSYAADYTPGIRALSAAIPYSVIQYTSAGCPPVLSYYAYDRPNCHAFNQHALDLIRQDHIRTVVISARWVDLQRRGLEQLRSTLEELRSLGVTVYVLGQSPMFTTDVQVIAFRRQGAARDSAARESAARAQDSWPVSFAPDLNPRLQAIAAAGGARFIDPLPHLCDGRVCPYREGDRFLFADEGHFSAFGSVEAVRAYFPLLDRAAARALPRNPAALSRPQAILAGKTGV